MGAEEQLQQRLRALFSEELSDGLQLLAPGLLDLEQLMGTAAGQERVQELFRTAHSLKGAAHAADVPEAIAACDRLESAFAAVREGELTVDSALVTRLLRETDALGSLLLDRGEQDASAAKTGPASLPPGPPPVPDLGATVSAPSLRLSAAAVDEVLRHAQQGLSAAGQLHEVVTQAVEVAEQVSAARDRLPRRGGSGSMPAGLDALLERAARAAAALVRSAEVADRTQSHVSAGIAQAAQRLRTQPFGTACMSLDRVVRDVAQSSGKSARLLVTGEEIDVDRSVITALREPLLHLVRNAVDHGLEPAPERIAAGKPEIGTIAIDARLEGRLLHVDVRDDGAGFDLDRLRAAASGRGIAPADDTLELAFAPGLTTSDEVTSISGRGVGLDAARACVEQLGGSLRVTSQAGVGATVQVTTPLTLAVVRVLLVRAAGQLVALPTSTVERVALVDHSALRDVGGTSVLALDDRSTRAVSLGGALGFSEPVTERRVTRSVGVVVPTVGDAVLTVDELVDERELALEPVPERLAGAAAVLGLALLPDGRVALVVNPVVVGRGASTAPPEPEPILAPAASRVLLAEDTVTTRALERSILEAAGYHVTVAVDGADAWQQLQSADVDLVLSDVDMPRMSGIELCRRIRSSSRLRELPVVLVTSLGSQGDRQRGLEAGADAYVVKGELQQGSLLDTIARLL